MLSEDYEQAQYLSSQVEQARQRAVLAASDSGASRDDARVAEQQAREHAKKAGLVVVNVDQAVKDAQDAADRAEAPTDAMVATLAGNPVSLTRAAVDQATGDMINTGGSTTQTAGDARWVTQSGADILVAAEIERTGSEIQVSGDNRWVTNEGADNTVSALFSAPNSAVQATADARYTKRGETIFNVRDYGAVGDGTTNDTAAIQAAVNAAGAAGGGNVVIPQTPLKTPYRAGRIYGQEGVNIEGLGLPRILRIGSTYGVVNLAVGNSRPFKMNLASTSDPYSAPGNIAIRGIVWDGGYGTVPHEPGGYNLFYFAAARNITFENNTVLDMVTNHAIDINGVVGLRVRNNRFLGYKDGTTEQNRGYVEAVQYGAFNETETVENSNNAAGAPSRDAIVEGNTFGNSTTLGTGPWPAGVGNHGAIVPATGVKLTGGITIRNNTFDGCTFVAVPIYTWDNVTVENNEFTNCQIGVRANNFTNGRRWNKATGTWDAAPYRIRSSDIKILRNHFTGTVQSDIQVLGTGLSSVDGSWDIIEKVQIIGNIRAFRTTRSSTEAIRIMLAKQVTIADNIGGYAPICIAVQACQDVDLSGNRMENSGNYGYLLNNYGAVEGQFSGKDYRVRGNRMQDSGSHGIGINDITSFAVIGNEVVDPNRSATGSGILMSGSGQGLVSANTVLLENPNPSAATVGINAVSGPGIRVTLDNLIIGLTSDWVRGTTGPGSGYGNIQYA